MRSDVNWAFLRNSLMKRDIAGVVDYVTRFETKESLDLALSMLEDYATKDGAGSDAWKAFHGVKATLSLQQDILQHEKWLEQAKGEKKKRLDIEGLQAPYAFLGSGKLERARFVRCNFERADFSKIYLREALFEHCNLSGADFSGCVLFDASITDCNVTEASFEGADLGGIKHLFVGNGVPNRIRFRGTNFRGVAGIHLSSGDYPDSIF